jgi:hypothetical protein
MTSDEWYKKYWEEHVKDCPNCKKKVIEEAKKLEIGTAGEQPAGTEGEPAGTDDNPTEEHEWF